MMVIACQLVWFWPGWSTSSFSIVVFNYRLIIGLWKVQTGFTSGTLDVSAKGMGVNLHTQGIVNSSINVSRLGWIGRLFVEVLVDRTIVDNIFFDNNLFDSKWWVKGTQRLVKYVVMLSQSLTRVVREMSVLRLNIDIADSFEYGIVGYLRTENCGIYIRVAAAVALHTTACFLTLLNLVEGQGVVGFPGHKVGEIYTMRANSGYIVRFLWTGLTNGVGRIDSLMSIVFQISEIGCCCGPCGHCRPAVCANWCVLCPTVGYGQVDFDGCLDTPTLRDVIVYLLLGLGPVHGRIDRVSMCGMMWMLP